MTKFLTVSVCLLASLAANASIKVTKCEDGATDSITIDGSFTDEELRNTKVVSAVKLATGSYELSEGEWEKICNVLIANRIYTIDLSETRFGYTLTRDNFGGKLTNWGNNNITNVTLSRYADVPSQCFSDNGKISSITLPNKKYDESIVIGDKAFGSMSALKTLYIGSVVREIGSALCECNYIGQSKLESVTFNTPSITEIPASTFKFCKTLKLVDLPTNLKEVGEGAFEDCGLENISFPITLTTIRTNAFDNCNLEYVVIPENVTLIETGAFQNNAKLKDVYVMGTDVKCQENGFSKNQNCLQFTNETTGYTEEQAARREDWKNGTETPIVLHFVAQGKDTFLNYENPYWIMLNTPGILDELKGFNTNEDNVKAFIEKYHLQHKNEFPWELYYYANGMNNQKAPFAYYKYKDNSGKEKTCKVWRKEFGYYAAEEIKKAGEDYAGWKQFLIIQDDAKQNTFEDEHRVDDRWYSMCFPFDLNANQIRTAYGAGTEVCEFVGAWESNEKDEQNRTILDFRFKPILEEEEAVAISEGFEENDARAASPVITKANRSYMIHPASKKEGDNTNVWYRIIPGIPMDEQRGEQANLIPTIPEKDFGQDVMNQFGDGESTLVEGFRFIGNYEDDVKIPASTYYFAYRDNSDGSRTLVLNHLTRESRYNWSPMTALVYEPQQAPSNNYAKKLTYRFAPAKDSETTGIQDVQAIASHDKVLRPSKVYNLNGQVVKEDTSLNGLGKGIYVVNGKKYIVK